MFHNVICHISVFNLQTFIRDILKLKIYLCFLVKMMDPLPQCAGLAVVGS